MYVVKTTFVVMINSSFIFSYYLQNIHHEAKKRQYILDVYHLKHFMWSSNGSHEYEKCDHKFLRLFFAL
jgi:hypothetical protein